MVFGVQYDPGHSSYCKVNCECRSFTAAYFRTGATLLLKEFYDLNNPKTQKKKCTAIIKVPKCPRVQLLCDSGAKF